MSLLERVIIAHRCRSTHHYIAMDALPLISGPDAEKWRNLVLVHNDELLAGAKAPDAVFKDFKNHVLHIGEGEWGGARDAAMAWYAEAVGQLQEKKWDKAIYALGVLSHYYADPIQPFHTGQTEEEGAIHRALEWSIAKSRNVIKARIDEIGYPDIKPGDGVGFVSDMVRQGAEMSHPHYQTFIDHYNLDVGVVNPEAGLDQTLIDITAGLVAHATAGLGVLFSRAFAEAGVAAPKVHITLPGYLSTLDIPIYWVAKKLDNASDKRTVKAMYREYKKIGKVIKTLPADDKEIRKAHARQVLRRPLAELDAKEIAPLGTLYEPRPEHAELAKEIAEEMAPEVEADIEAEAGIAAPETGELETVEEVAKTPAETAAKADENVAPAEAVSDLVEAAAEVKAKPAKATKRKRKKPKMRVTAAVSEPITEPVTESISGSAIETKETITDDPVADVAALKAVADAERLAREEADRAEQARLEAERVEAERQEAERLAAEAKAAAEAEQAEKAELARQEAEELARMEAEEAERLAAEEAKAKEEAQEALRVASEERARKAEEEKARLEAEEMARIEAEETARIEAEAEAKEVARFEAREAAEFARLEAEEAAELARMEAEETARLAAEEEEFAKLEAEEAERIAAEKAAEEEAAWAQLQSEEGEQEEEFSLEELAAFDSNLTENGDAAPAEQVAPPVSSFFDAPNTEPRPRTRLMGEDPVIDAPSIGKKTARRLNRVGIFTVDDLLNCDSEEIAFEVDVRHIDEPTLEDWKSQARLMIEVPGLRVHDAQILVGAGVRSAEDLANASATRIFHASMGFLKTNEGSRIVRDDHVLHETEVSEWIDLAKESEAA